MRTADDHPECPLCYNRRMGTLYLVATPIGNLEDITLRALRILREARLIAAEDTRRTKKLLTRYQISTQLLSYHEHNKDFRQEQLLGALVEGDAALVSDAGTPGLSDPGYELVQAVLEAGHHVSPIPGASAPISALVVSGLPTDSFVFLGYLPRKRTERQRLLASVAGECRTMVMFEVPHRLHRSLEDLAAAFGGERRVAVCRELTKMHEEILRGTLDRVRGHFAEVEPRGEFTLVVAGAPATSRWEEADVREALAVRKGEGVGSSEAARQVAKESGWARNEVYRLAMEERES